MTESNYNKMNLLSSKKDYDYGVNLDWESVKDLCINKKINEYNYKFCFFKEIKQDHILIGTYDGWGKLLESEEEKLRNKKSEDKKIEDVYYSHQIYNAGIMCPVIVS
jgi:hypothetical protein